MMQLRHKKIIDCKAKQNRLCHLCFEDFYVFLWNSSFFAFFSRFRCLLILIYVLLLSIELAIRCIVDTTPASPVVVIELLYNHFLEVLLHLVLREEVSLFAWQMTVLQRLFQNLIRELVRVWHRILCLDLNRKRRNDISTSSSLQKRLLAILTSMSFWPNFFSLS